MKKVIVNNGRDDAVADIAKVEEKYKAKFVGQLCMKTSGDGEWAGDSCGDVYYQAVPPVEGYSNYFAIFNQGGSMYITSGASAVNGIIAGVIADDGEIVYSRFRHDYRTSTDSSCFIDGGRDYAKTNRQTIGLKIVDGEWYQLEEEDYIVMKLKGKDSV